MYSIHVRVYSLLSTLFRVFPQSTMTMSPEDEALEISLTTVVVVVVVVVAVVSLPLVVMLAPGGKRPISAIISGVSLKLSSWLLLNSRSASFVTTSTLAAPPPHWEWISFRLAYSVFSTSSCSSSSLMRSCSRLTSSRPSRAYTGPRSNLNVSGNVYS